MTPDLFGNRPPVDDVPTKTWASEYKEYIASSRWKQKRQRAIEQAGNQCQVCGVYGTSHTRLEVHHKTYERFKNERPEDLEVVCKECHLERDKVRAKESTWRAAQALEDARLDGWATKVYGDHWRERGDHEEIAWRFERWLEKKYEW